MIRVYGIPEEIHRCHACRTVKKLLDDVGASYEFIPVISKHGNDTIFDRETIKKLAALIGSKTLALSYPIVTFKNSPLNDLAALRSLLISLGHDSDLVEE